VNLELAASRRSQTSRDFDHLIVKEVQASDRELRLRLTRLFFQPDHASLLVEFHDTISLRVTDPITEHRGALLACSRRTKVVRQVRAVKDVVAKRETHSIRPDKLLPNDKGLRETLRRGLRGILDVQANVTTVIKQAPETVLLVGSRDHEDVADARQHQQRQRIVDERLIENRQELFADGSGQRMQP
jgi:hypothetical protein